jgi:hypothetical protein
MAGAEWSKAARETAVTLVTASRRRPPTIGVLLLRDLKKVFDGHAGDDVRLHTDTIITELCQVPESPWPTIRKGEPIDDRGLSSRLRKYGISSKSQRVGAAVFKGYSKAQFTDAWKRYVDALLLDDDDNALAPEEDLPVTPVTGDTLEVNEPGPVTGVTDVTDSKGQAGAQFQPPNGPGRCPGCSWHVEKQGHADDCDVRDAS